MSFNIIGSGGIFICPNCSSPIYLQSGSLVCKNRHCFDIAKSGYVNLLIAKGTVHGDNKDMITARKNFLSKGYYEPLLDKIRSAANKYTASNSVVLDAGCGEGYYTQGVASSIDGSQVFGIDISKDALSVAAKRDGISACAVASVYHMPVADECCDLLMSVFSPFCREEFLRVMKSGSVLINVIPARQHLWELKCAVYDTPYENEVADYAVDGCELIDKIEVNSEINPSGTDLRDLFAMTPYFYRTSEKDKEKMKNLDSVRTKIQFEILVYRKSI